MSLDNVQNKGQKNISWESISKKLKANNADQKTIDKMKSVFQSFDRNFDNILSQDEINNAFELLNALDKTKDGKLSQEELNASKYNNSFKQAGAETTNQFIEILGNPENPHSERVSAEGGGLRLQVRHHPQIQLQLQVHRQQHRKSLRNQPVTEQNKIYPNTNTTLTVT